MFVSFFGQKRGSLYYGRMAWGIRYGSLGAWDLRFGRLRYTTASNARFRFKNLNYGSSKYGGILGAAQLAYLRGLFLEGI